MVRALALDEMTPDAPPDEVARTVVATGEIGDTEITQRLREAFDRTYPVLPVPGHPVMRPEPRFVQFVSALSLDSHFSLFFFANRFGRGTLV